MLTIFRGDDMAFAEFDRKVCIRFNTCHDLTGWAAKFCLYDNVKMTQDVSSRIWTFGYSAEETQVLPLGKTFGRLIVIDPTGQVRQMSKVEVEVVNQKLEPCIAGYIAISVDNVIADYNNMGNKPSINGKIVEGEHDSEYYGLASKELVDSLADLPVRMDTLTGKVSALDENVSNLSSRIEEETIARERVDRELSESITAERVSRENAIANVTEGATPITRLLFVADGDDENYYRIQVVMRDDGSGSMVPALALDTVPRDNEEVSEG